MLTLICETTDCWQATGSMLQGWATLAGALAVVYAAKKGADTFAAFRRQKQEERRIDAAERILTLAYRLRRNLRAVRGPFLWAAELEEARKRLSFWESLTEVQKNRATAAQVTFDRLAAYKADWDEIFVQMPIARALFGRDVEEQLEAIWEQVSNVRHAADTYAEDNGSDKEFTLQLRRDLWSTGRSPDEDKVGTAVENAVTRLEESLLPVIRAS